MERGKRENLIEKNEKTGGKEEDGFGYNESGFYYYYFIIMVV